MTRLRKYRMFHTDAFEWLPRQPKKSLHAVVTDPPFGIVEYSSEQLDKRRNGRGGIWRLPQVFDGHERSPIPRFTVLGPSDHASIRKFHERLAGLLWEVLVPGGHVLIASNNLISHLVLSAFAAAQFEIRGQIARVVKTLRGGDRPKGAHREFPGVSVTPRACWEPWLIFRKPCEGRVQDNLRKWSTGALRRLSNHQPFIDLIHSSPARGIEKELAPHPSLKPQAFMRQMVWAALPLGEGIILDPFMGSGASIAAAEALGLHSIGLEVDKEYFMMAKRAVPELAELQSNGMSREIASFSVNGARLTGR